jgi:hypothetical protein
MLQLSNINSLSNKPTLSPEVNVLLKVNWRECEILFTLIAIFEYGGTNVM